MGDQRTVARPSRLVAGLRGGSPDAPLGEHTCAGRAHDAFELVGYARALHDYVSTDRSVPVRKAQDSTMSVHCCSM
jgi:hypothetical protein